MLDVGIVPLLCTWDWIRPELDSFAAIICSLSPETFLPFGSHDNLPNLHETKPRTKYIHGPIEVYTTWYKVPSLETAKGSGGQNVKNKLVNNTGSLLQ